MDKKLQDPNFREVIGSKIKLLRKAADMTQNDLKKALGLSSSGIISQIEKGERNLKMENMVKLAGILQVPITVFFEDSMFDQQGAVYIRKFHQLYLKKNRSQKSRTQYAMIAKLLEEV